MARAPHFAGVILAAGESSRMGSDKALLPWRGSTFLAAAIEALRPHTQIILVVAGKNADGLSSLVYAAGADLAINRRPERGQFSSLQTGLQEVLNRGRDAAIVTLIDRPPAEPQTITYLRERFDEITPLGWWAVVPQYQNAHGHPIVIGREMMEAFLKAPVTSTARDVEHAFPNKIEYLPVNDAAVTTNVDTPEEYQRLAK